MRVRWLVGWGGWITFAWSVIAELLAHILGWRLPAISWQRRASASLIAAIALMVSSPAIASGPATPVQAAPVVAAPQIQVPMTATAAAPVPSTGYVEHLV